MKRAAVFFDRDGVLNRDVGYAHRPDQIEWTPGAAEAVRLANAERRLVFVVTNQSGVARGLYDEAAVQALHLWMSKELAEQGARIDEFAYCPHHPEGVVEAYTHVCGCRKPAAGMIEMLIHKHDVDRDRSFLIGDQSRDLEAAGAAHLSGLLYDGGSLLPYVQAGLALTALEHVRGAKD